MRRRDMAGPELSVLAETPEIGGNDGLYRARRNPKPFERATFALCLLGDDDVAFEQRDLIRREWRIRQELQEQRLESREPERDRHQQPATLDRRQDELQDLLETENLWPAQFIDEAGLGFPLDRRRDRFSDIANENRLELRLPPADQRQRRQEPGQSRKAIEEIILRSEHDRRANNNGGGHRGEHRLVRASLGLGIAGPGLFIGG